MTEIQMIKTENISGIARLRLFLSLALLIFEFVSNFDIRASKFVDNITNAAFDTTY